MLYAAVELLGFVSLRRVTHCDSSSLRELQHIASSTMAICIEINLGDWIQLVTQAPPACDT